MFKGQVHFIKQLLIRCSFQNSLSLVIVFLRASCLNRQAKQKAEREDAEKYLFFFFFKVLSNGKEIQRELDLSLVSHPQDLGNEIITESLSVFVPRALLDSAYSCKLNVLREMQLSFNLEAG